MAPGIDIERDILAHMDFGPLVDTPAAMPAALFEAAPMDLRTRLLAIDLTDRVTYDADRKRLFLNFRHLNLRRLEDVERIREAVEARCREIGHRVATIVNYDGFQLDPDVAEAYARMSREMEAQYYQPRLALCQRRLPAHAARTPALAGRGADDLRDRAGSGGLSSAGAGLIGSLDPPGRGLG